VTDLAVPTPTTEGLAASYSMLLAAQERLRAARTRADRNTQGGDAGHQFDQGLVLRHAVNYWLAVQLALEGRGGLPGGVVDVGAGAGAFSAWAAALLDRPLTIVEPDDAHRGLAAAAFPETTVVAAMTEAVPSPVVLAMEVIEHVERPAQSAFLAELLTLVAPGGVAVLSTPDETGYPGGWSGYAPHVGQVGALQLRGLLGEVTDWPVDVLRIDGPGFVLGRVARVGVPVANRAWTLVQRAAPGVADRLTHWSSRAGERVAGAPEVDDRAFSVTRASIGAGTGLLAVVRAPLG
jgi:hypothetical protein